MIRSTADLKAGKVLAALALAVAVVTGLASCAQESGLPGTASAQTTGDTLPGSVVQLSAAAELTVLLEDGTVLSGLRSEDPSPGARSWTGVTQVDSEGENIVGLTEEGTLLFCTGFSESDLPARFREQEIQNRWQDLIQGTAGENLIAGLRSDGTVVVLDSPMFPHSSEVKVRAEAYEDISAIDGGGNYFVALCRDGTVEADYIFGRERPVGTPPEEWEQVVAVSAGDQHMLGLKEDGTVYAFGHPDSGIAEAETWTGMRQVSAGHRFCSGLRADGTVAAAGALFPLSSDIVSAWTDVVQISGGVDLFALTSDGRILSTDPEFSENGLRSS